MMLKEIILSLMSNVTVEEFTNLSLLKSLCKWSLSLEQVLRSSPSPAFRAVWNIAQNHFPLARDLFNAAFVSCWTELSEVHQDELIQSLEEALTIADLPEITQVCCHDVLLTQKGFYIAHRVKCNFNFVFLLDPPEFGRIHGTLWQRAPTSGSSNTRGMRHEGQSSRKGFALQGRRVP